MTPMASYLRSWSNRVADFADGICKGAKAVDLAAEDRADLVSSTINAGLTKLTSLSATDLPAECHAIRIGRFNGHLRPDEGVLGGGKCSCCRNKLVGLWCGDDQRGISA